MRPLPPADLDAGFRADSSLVNWIHATFIRPDGALHNDEHTHLNDAFIGALWTTAPHQKQGRMVVGLAEIPSFKGHRWAIARQEAQMAAWFGGLPDFVLTFDAEYARECDDATWCALVEHELYHCAQAVDEFGEPKFRRDGRPVFTMRGHDAEEFVGVVRRYGVGAAAGGVAALVSAAQQAPLIAPAAVAGACGTCLRMVA